MFSWANVSRIDDLTCVTNLLFVPLGCAVAVAGAADPLVVVAWVPPTGVTARLRLDEADDDVCVWLGGVDAVLGEPVFTGAVCCVPLGIVEPLKLAATEFVAVATAETAGDVATELPESVSVQAVNTSPVGSWMPLSKDSTLDGNCVVAVYAID